MESDNEIRADKLILAVKDHGAENAFNLLYYTYEKRIENYIQHHLWNSNCIDPECHKFDVKQDAFSSVLTALTKYAKGAYKTEFTYPLKWLYKISKNKIYDHFKLRRCTILSPSSTIFIEDIDHSISDDGLFVNQVNFNQEYNSLIIQAKESLSRIYQEAIEDKAAGLTDSEIAKIRHIKESNARRRRLRAVQQFDRALIERGVDIRGKNNE